MIGRATMERDVLVLATGGTIGMRGQGSSPGGGSHAVPAKGARDLLDAVGLTGVQARDLLARPGAHIDLADALLVARTAVEHAATGRGVVVLHGTDTLEETAFLCDLLLGGDAPVVFTGAIRPGGAPGADGPANLLDAVAVAGAPSAAGLGCVVVFGGEVHAARAARKVDSAGPSAFGSPGGGQLGRVVEGRLALRARPVRPVAALAPARLDFAVPIVTAALGDDLALLDAPADGAVLVAFGGGHLAPAGLARLRAAAARMPVALTVRPERGALLHATYGFEGAEGDLRASGAVPAGGLSAPAARMKLLACLGCGLDRAGIAEAFANDDS
ncbi:MAG: L-asparaginase [Solirubrobacteraceae bacterium]|nr:L-asparaginase [Solirubrobacteraceae bacterium]